MKIRIAPFLVSLFVAVAVPIGWSQTTQELSPKEKQDLQFMIEEEKLARDVYAELGKKWGRPFSNIVRSETRHMELVEGFLETYQIENPTLGVRPGQFKNAELQKMFTELVRQGQASRIEALKAGALIEEKDIFDLSKLAEATQKPDLKRVYSNLTSASENHLRAFMSNLKSAGGSYKPRFLSQATLDRIVGHQ